MNGLKVPRKILIGDLIPGLIMAVVSFPGDGRPARGSITIHGCLVGSQYSHNHCGGAGSIRCDFALGWSERFALVDRGEGPISKGPMTWASAKFQFLMAWAYYLSCILIFQP